MKRRRSTGRLLAAAAVLATTTLTAAMVSTTSGWASTPGPGGTSASDAAASCWQIKQDNSAAKDGVYWLQTPMLVAPEQFYCDMTTDGGGWVLIGRGRQGWRPDYQGLGNPAQVHDPVTGPAAFNVRQLPSKTVDALMNGGKVSALADGIRVRRAMNTSGTRWQDARIKLAKQDGWVWSFGAGLPVASFDFDGAQGTGGNTTDFGSNNWYNHIDTRENDPGQHWAGGWSFGRYVSGTDSPTSYLWSGTNGAGYARPFTQIYIRPKLISSQLNYPAIPDTGTAASTLSPLLQSGAQPQQWGVTGRVEDPASEHDTEAQAATQIGDTVFVGGNFKYVQKGANPSADDKVQQSFLAGFNVHSGAWVSSFRPTFNGQVKALAALPNGDLVAGGDFTEVNGKPAVGLVALDPTTGQIAPNWSISVQNRLNCCSVDIWSLQVAAGQLYIGGAFTHLKGGNQKYWVFARNAGRASLSDGTVDRDWNPNFNGTVYDMNIGSNGQRFYAAGHMTWSNQQPTDSMAIVSTSAGAALVPGMKQPHFSNPGSGHYQQMIREVGDRVWLGGSEHSLFSYSRSDFSLLSTNITLSGGDFQADVLVDGVLYAGCHCGNWNYSGADTWPDVGTAWTEANKIDYVGAWDTATGNYVPAFNPWMNTTHGQGLWGAFEDSTGTVWMLGDFDQARTTSGSFEWEGGFVRFASRDTTAPTTPTSLTSSDLGNGRLRLSWHGSTDNRGTVGYEVLRDDRVIGTTDQTSLDVAASGSHKYFVRAVDAAGNRSASTPALVANG